METKKLFKLLTVLDNVMIRKWETVSRIVEFIKKEQVEILKKDWANSHYNSYRSLELSDINTWSTFDQTCVKLRFYNAATPEKPKNKLMCDVEIYDGDSFGGYRKGLRFTALLLMSNKFIHEIEKYILFEFERYLESAYENHLEAQKKAWMYYAKLQIINKL